MKKIISIILALVLVLSLAACGKSAADKGGTENADSGSTAASQSSGGSKWDYGTKETEAASKKLTMDEAKVRLVCYDGSHADSGINYLLLAYYGPQDEIGYNLCNPDGTAIEDLEWPTYWKYENGWRLFETYELPAGYTADNIALYIADYAADGEPSRVFTDFGEPLAKAELEDIGLVFLGDRMCNFQPKGGLGSRIVDVVMQVGIYWYHGKTVWEDNLPFDIEDFAFYAEDGRPLNECIGDDFEYIVETYGDYQSFLEMSTVEGIRVRLKMKDGSYSEEKMEELCDLIAELNPYMVYTNEDGTEVRLDYVLVRF